MEMLDHRQTRMAIAQVVVVVMMPLMMMTTTTMH
jgi:hypothetical protein